MAKLKCFTRKDNKQVVCRGSAHAKGFTTKKIKSGPSARKARKPKIVIKKHKPKKTKIVIKKHKPKKKKKVKVVIKKHKPKKRRVRVAKYGRFGDGTRFKYWHTLA